MDYETLTVLLQSRKTILSVLAARGYNTKPYEKFGPVEIAAMAAAASKGGSDAFRMDLERQAEPIRKCRVIYSLERVKNKIKAFLDRLLDTDENSDAINPADTELVVMLIEPVAETFHVAALNIYASKKLRVNFFQAHTIVNNPMEHVLQPKFELMPKSEQAEFLKANMIKSFGNLPQIKFHEDIVARIMGLLPGDIVKIIRASPSAGEYISYRICAP
jgi:DNA-directed RNA polymerase subunit H (RpoH/RPB5)